MSPEAPKTLCSSCASSGLHNARFNVQPATRFTRSRHILRLGGKRLPPATVLMPSEKLPRLSDATAHLEYQAWTLRRDQSSTRVWRVDCIFTRTQQECFCWWRKNNLLIRAPREAVNQTADAGSIRCGHCVAY